MSDILLKTKITEAIFLRESKKAEEALVILKDLLLLHPCHPDVNFQVAWTFDFFLIN